MAYTEYSVHLTRDGLVLSLWDWVHSIAFRKNKAMAQSVDVRTAIFTLLEINSQVSYEMGK
jgi:hypothetical protein